MGSDVDPCTIGMEACSSAHHWGRRFSAYGHTVRLMAAEFARTYSYTRNSVATRPAIQRRSGMSEIVQRDANVSADRRS